MSTAAKTARIVVVEDNPADVYLVRQALEEKGIQFELTCFADGEMALKALSLRGNKAPDLILLDLNLPTIEGIAVLRTIRSMPKLADVPVGILTSSESPQDMNRTAILGAARYIKKPLTLDDFLREVGRGVEEMLRAKDLT